MPYYNQYPMYPNQNFYQPNTMQIQNGGFVSVRSEDEARNYPVELGKSITFKDEGLPYIYTKTMGFSQLDRPIFEKYRLVKENGSVASSEAHTDTIKENVTNTSNYAEKSEIEAIRKEIDSLWESVKLLQEKRNPKKKEVIEDEQ